MSMYQQLDENPGVFLVFWYPELIILPVIGQRKCSIYLVPFQCLG